MSQNNARANSKKVIDVSTGVVYDSVIMAATENNIGRTAMMNRIKDSSKPFLFV
jgi:hypothetical protein